MSTDETHGGAPLMQRLYDRIWLLAVLAIVFWTLSYVAWGVADVFAVG
jgi:hypothetical protein